ncbi:hypothetical protein Vadar_020155 [Vaccinium darrowii]|uniref:Uncharacterized protein n=1 Tax=Vaccinium darrowii TaxID=229202 RepID=A0ACB7Z5N7_9ERIC|nr:hypothetical protein Vadar_020155 [Vaccinium darrowii]
MTFANTTPILVAQAANPQTSSLSSAAPISGGQTSSGPLLPTPLPYQFPFCPPQPFLITFSNSNVPESHFLPMSSKKTKSSETLSNGERISGFPEPVIHHIMSFLPPVDVIRTRNLSKTWHSLWSTSPNLDFDQTAFKLALPTLSV